MTDLYFLDAPWHRLLLLYGCFLICLQAFLLTEAPHLGDRRHRAGLLREGILLVFAILFVYPLLAQPLQARYLGGLILPSLTGWRYAAGAAALATLALEQRCLPRDLCLAAAVVLTLPGVMARLGWPGLAAALVLWTLREFFAARLLWHQRRDLLTPHTIKAAMDNLPLGLAFARKDGNIFLANTAFLDLCYQRFGRYYGDLRHFWHDAATCPPNRCLALQRLGMELFLRFPDGQAVLLSRSELQTPDGPMTQILVKDVTAEDAVNRQLQEQNALLAEQGGKIKDLLGRLEEITQEQVATKIRFFIHDLLGQRLALVQHLIDTDADGAAARVAPLLDEVIREMKMSRASKPETVLSNILSTYRKIGITVHCHGRLPEDARTAEAFVDIIREGLTNAVRHGHCDKVVIRLAGTRGRYTLDLFDNGGGTAAPPRFGTGLTGMRERMESLGGVLRVGHRPLFRIHCETERPPA